MFSSRLLHSACFFIFFTFSNFSSSLVTCHCPRFFFLYILSRLSLVSSPSVYSSALITFFLNSLASFIQHFIIRQRYFGFCYSFTYFLGRKEARPRLSLFSCPLHYLLRLLVWPFLSSFFSVLLSFIPRFFSYCFARRTLSV